MTTMPGDKYDEAVVWKIFWQILRIDCLSCESDECDRLFFYSCGVDNVAFVGLATCGESLALDDASCDVCARHVFVGVDEQNHICALGLFEEKGFHKA